jgi:hypothetical protein
MAGIQGDSVHFFGVCSLSITHQLATTIQSRVRHSESQTRPVVLLCLLFVWSTTFELAIGNSCFVGIQGGTLDYIPSERFAIA